MGCGEEGTLRLWDAEWDAEDGTLTRVHGFGDEGGVAVWEPAESRVLQPAVTLGAGLSGGCRGCHVPRVASPWNRTARCIRAERTMRVE